MDKIKYRISLDMHSSVSQASLAAKQGDDNRQFSITLRSGGQPYKIERGAFAVFSTTLPDGKVIEDNCIIVDDEILYDFTQNLTSQVGVLNIEIRLYGPNSNLVTSPTFILVVSPRAAKAEEIESTNSFTSLDAMYNKLNGIANEVQTKLENGEFVGESGLDAGFGKVTAEAASRSPGTPPTVTVETSGPNTAKNFNFTFEIPVPTSLDFKVDPVFANNSWETIAKVARYGDPSKYWKVGDYKLVEFPASLSIDSTFFKIVDMEALRNVISNMAGTYKLEFWLREEATTTDLLYTMGIRLIEPTGTMIWTEKHQTKNQLYNDGLFDCGIAIKTYGFLYDGLTINTTLTAVGGGAYPLQIIGLNHDKVTDPYNYGKQKAGMTLQLGASRDVYGDDKASIFTKPIDGIMTADGKHYKSPNKVLADYAEGATNWAEGGFRIALQSLFDDSEIAPYLAEVQKYTSQYYNDINKYCSPILSKDKVFLPSEYEIFGIVAKSPAPEGKQYEFYEDGYSKFMWSKELLDGTISGARIWLRSAAAEKVNKDNPNSIYGTSIYLGVYNLDPLNISYMPSGVASGDSVPAYIAPCICL